MGSRLLLAPLLLSAACSIIYDPDNLQGPDASTIDAPALDADPSGLDLTGFTPASLLEGTGAAGGRPALVYLEGTAVVGTATVTAAWEPAGPEPAPELVGFDGFVDSRGGVVALRLPVLPELGAGQQRTVRITVTQGGATDVVDVPVDGLPELRIAAGASTMVDPTPDLYSRIEIVANLHYAPGQATPAVLRATADVVIDAVLDADAAGTMPGPGGCRGGAAASAGECNPGAGAAGSNEALIANGSGGGGGGFGAAASNGSGPEGGTGGMATGTELLVPFGTGAGNRGNGGGGGGPGGLTGATAGGAGGGGGGSIAIEAGGDITVTTGAVRAKGASGSGGAGAAGGGGGGGSGGALLVRSGGTIRASGAWLSAPGGSAGGGNNPGAAGAVGRIRIDAAAGATADLEAMATTPPPVRGPSWDLATPAIATSSPVTLTLRGQPGRIHAVRVDDVLVREATIGASGTTPVAVALTGRRNLVCAAWSGNGATSLERREAQSCVEVAFVGPLP